MFESKERYSSSKKKDEIKGKVVNCESLNVRYQPNIDAPVMVVIQKDHEVVIDKNESSTDWLAVKTETGVEGYCMSNYIEIEK